VSSVNGIIVWTITLNKVFIAGNHDWGFQINTEKVKEILDFYGNITYLQDNEVLVGEKLVSVYGSPWQPEFYNWAFNLPRKGDELKEKWDNIPSNTDILNYSRTCLWLC
jgi:hypothetical protein